MTETVVILLVIIDIDIIISMAIPRDLVPFRLRAYPEAYKAARHYVLRAERPLE